MTVRLPTIVRELCALYAIAIAVMIPYGVRVAIQYDRPGDPVLVLVYAAAAALSLLAVAAMILALTHQFRARILWAVLGILVTGIVMSRALAGT